MVRFKELKANMRIQPLVTKCSGTTYYVENTFLILQKNILPTSDNIISSTNEFIQSVDNIHFPVKCAIAYLDVISFSGPDLTL